jgi:hypothetical protein
VDLIMIFTMSRISQRRKVSTAVKNGQVAAGMAAEMRSEKTQNISSW